VHADAVSLAALKRKKMLENELEKLQGTKFQLEMNVNTLESAKINQETMLAMKKAADALKTIHGDLYVHSMIFQRRMCSYVGVQLDRQG
jgi:charged multivesicular body protein 4